MSNRLENPAAPAVVQDNGAFALVHHGHEEIGREKQQSSTELRRRDTNDSKRMLIHLNNTADYTTIILKMAVPIRMTEHNVRSAVRTVLIRGVENAAKIRLNAEYVEVVPADFKDPGLGQVVARVQSYRGGIKCSQVFEAAVAIAQIEIVRIGLPSPLAALDSVEALRARHIQRAQYQGIQHAENHGVRANRHCQRDNRDKGKAGRFAQHAHSEAQILCENFD